MNDEYLTGVADCKNGLPAAISGSPAYYEGYGDQYTLEQQQTAKSESEHE
jgi:hypothetical protein